MRDCSKLQDKENVEFLRNLAKLLQAKGFKDVRIVPQIFVATAKNAGEQEVESFSFEGELLLVGAAKKSEPETVLPRS